MIAFSRVRTHEMDEVVIWQWQDDSKNWNSYESHVSNFIEENRQRIWSTNIKIGIPDEKLANYVVDEQRKIQRNIRTGMNVIIYFLIVHDKRFRGCIAKIR